MPWHVTGPGVDAFVVPDPSFAQNEISFPVLIPIPIPMEIPFPVLIRILIPIPIPVLAPSQEGERYVTAALHTEGAETPRHRGSFMRPPDAFGDSNFYLLTDSRPLGAAFT